MKRLLQMCVVGWVAVGAQHWAVTAAGPNASKAESPDPPLMLPSSARDRSPHAPHPSRALTPRRPSSRATAGLALVVLGLMVFVWTTKRRRGARTKGLPPEVWQPLGRALVGPKQHVHLFRLGSKLVLLAETPEGWTPISEITDPNETQRLIHLCQRPA